MQDVTFKKSWSHWTPEKTIDFEPGTEKVTNEIADAAREAGVLEEANGGRSDPGNKAGGAGKA